MKTLALDIDELLNAIPGDEPAGDATAYRYHLREEICELRREELPTDFDDATRPAQLKRADWAEVIHLCTTTLQASAKDLRVACHLVEALVKEDGFAGLRTGLTLLARLLADCWDRLLPAVEDNDYEERAVLLENMLDDADRGVLFPHVVRRAPLFGTEGEKYSLADWVRITQLEKSADKEAVQQALAATPTEWIDSVAADVDASAEQFTALCAVLQQRMGDAAPALTNLRAAIVECQQFVRECLKHHAAAPSEPATAATDSAAANGAPAAATVAASSAIPSRQEAYALLGQVADALARVEPHSPTPYLVRRAIELGRLPFPQWIPSLLREESVLADLLKGVERGDAAGAR